MFRFLRIARIASPVLALALFSSVQAVQAEDVATVAKASVVVSVVKADSSPAAGVTVQLTSGGAAQGGKGKKANKPAAEANAADPTTKPAGAMSGTTDAEGKVTMTNVPDGTYTVMARSKADGRGRASVVVADGKDAAVTITLKPTKKIAADPTTPTPPAEAK